MATTITREATHEVYELGRDVFEGRRRPSEAKRRLAGRNIMSESSAAEYLRAYSQMRKGIGYKRTINEYSTGYFLRCIYRDEGDAALKVALQAVAGHVEYYESVESGNVHYAAAFLSRYRDGVPADEVDDLILPGDLSSEMSGLQEGTVKSVLVNRYERNPRARRECIEAFGAVCAVCEFDFGRAYGDAGEGFIHVHHLVEISSVGTDYQVDPHSDLVPVCPNCHSMLHRFKPPIQVDDLRKMLRFRVEYQS